MERTGYIRGRDDEGERDTVMVMLRFEIFLRDPILIPLFLYAVRRKAFF
jgi:hypothetical protein